MIRYALFRRVGALIVALALTVAGTAGVVALSSDTANAASQRSYGGYWSPYGGFIGNYLNSATGTYVYCVDLWANDVASGGTGVSVNEITAHGGGQIAGELGQILGGTRSVKGEDLQKLNYAVSVHGQTTDNFTAAAVAAYVWSLTSDNFYGNGEHFIAGPYSAQIIAKYQQIAADTVKNFNTGGDGSGQVALTVDPENNYQGTVQISGLDPSHALGSVTLSNAVFAESGSVTQTGLVNNTTLDIVAVPPTNTASFSVQSEASFVASIPVTYASNVQLFSDTGQRSVGPGESRDQVNFTLQAEDPTPRSVLFQPTVATTVAAKFVQQGEQFADVLRFSTAADENGVHNPWFQEADLKYLPINAVGTIYGPFLSQPTESDEVPANAPVAADNIRVTTDPLSGPTIEYTANSNLTSSEAGYYTWVWRIAAADQTEHAQTYLPAEYVFQDRFGQISETSITPSRLSIVTKASTPEGQIGESVYDRVNLDVIQGGWVQTGGDRTPVKLTGSAYFTKSQPVLADTPPQDAEIIGNLSLTVNKPGSYLSDHITLPNTPGYVTFQWCLLPEEQPEDVRNMVTATCDKFGQPSEVVKILSSEALASTGEKNNNSQHILLASTSTFFAGAGIIGLGVSALGKPVGTIRRTRSPRRVGFVRRTRSPRRVGSTHVASRIG